MRRNKSGISLIVLVIAIIIMIILAGAIILSLSNSGIIGKSQEAVDAANLQEVQQMAALAWADAYLDKLDDDTVNIEDRVKQALKDNKVNVDNYNIVITDDGVEVSAKSSGETGGESGEESDDQVVEETDSLKGTWIFKEATEIGDITYEWSISFTCNRTTYSKLKLEAKSEADAPGPGTMYYDDTWVYGSVVSWDWAGGDTNSYSDSPYTVINITSKYEDVENAEVLLNWLQANATKADPLAQPQISISGTTLTITPVSNATGYDIYVNDIRRINTSSTTFELTNLYIDVGTYKVHVKATAKGFSDSAMSNRELYEVTQFVEILTGTWNFNSTINIAESFTSNVNFKSNADTEYGSITVTYAPTTFGDGNMSYDNTQVWYVSEWYMGLDSANTPFNPIVITSSIKDVTNPDKLMQFLLANAVKQ